MRKLGFCLLILVLSSCETELQEMKRPKNLVPKDTMVLVLSDVMVIEYHVQSRYPRPDQFHECIKRSGDTILANYQLNYKRFTHSLDYYASKQDVMEEIYDKVIENLTKKLNQLKVQ